MLPELLANTNGPIALLATPINAEALSLAVSTPAPEALRGEGQFRIQVDSELLLIEGPVGTSTVWTVLERGVENSGAVQHGGGTEIFHKLTAGGVAAATAPHARTVHNLAAATALAWGGDYYCQANTNYELTVPTAVGHAGEDIRVRIISGAGAVTLKGVQTIDGEPSLVLGLEPEQAFRAVTITSDGSVLHTF